MMGPPKLLLDTNVLRKLAHGDLLEYEDRLLAVSGSPSRQWWLPEIAVLELLAHVEDADEARLLWIVGALRWADALAGNQLAEGYDFAIRSGVCVRPIDHNREERIEINRVRRRMIRITCRSDLSADLLDVARRMRSLTEKQRAIWARDTAETMAIIKRPLAPGDRPLRGAAIISTSIGIMADILVGVAKKYADEESAARPPSEIKCNLREFFHFDATIIVKALGTGGYNFEKNANDCHDHLLCAYPAAGYHLVTFDDRLRNALAYSGCPDPRVISLDEGLKRAEAWLANQALNPTGAGAPAG